MRSRVIDLLLLVSIFSLTWVIFVPFAVIGVDPHHDGIMLKPALDVASGQTLFRDTFTQYGTLTTGLQAGALKILGPSLKALKLANVFFYSVGITLFSALWLRLLPRLLVAVSFGMWLIFAPFFNVDFPMLAWSSVVALPFQALTMIFLLGSLDGKKNASYWAGFSAAATLWCRMPVGLLLFAGLILVYSWIDRDSLKKCVLGFFGVLAFFLLQLSWRGSLLPWWEQAVIWPRNWARAHGASFGIVLRCLFPDSKNGAWMHRPLLVPGGGWPSLIPLAVLIYTLSEFLKMIRIKAFDRAGFAIGVVCLASWAQFYPISCPRHIFWGLTPSFGLLVYIAFKAFQGERFYFLGGLGRREIMTAVFFAALFIYPALDRYNAARSILSADYVVLNQNQVLAGMKVRAAQAVDLSRVAWVIQDYLQKHPDAALATMGPDALYGTFFANRSNPGPYSVEWGIGGEKETLLREKFIRTQKPVILVQNHSDADVEKVKQSFTYKEMAHFPSLNLHLLMPL